MGDVSVALISMPFAALNLPSIGLSLLRAALERDGHKADVYYLNLNFADLIGVDLYNRISDPPTVTLMGEWLFSDGLFGSNPDPKYLDEFLSPLVGRGVTEKTLQELPEARAQVDSYLAACMEAVDWAQYDIIGFSSVFAQNVPSLALARRLKARYPDKLIAMGGANVEGIMGHALLKAFPFIDLVCSGEGDVAFPEFIRRFAAGESLSGVPGITLQGNSPQTGDPVNAPACDLDALPYPNYDDYFEQLNRHAYRPELQASLRILFESSRGCWWGAKSHCTFCGLNGSKLAFRSKSADRALAELRYLFERYQGHTKAVSAVDNIIDMKYFRQFLPSLKALGLEAAMFYETKANLTREQVQLLSEAGTQDIQPGIESLSTSVLSLMHKGTTRLQNIQVLKWCREFGVKANWNHLYGFPNEEPEEYQRIAHELLPAISHLQPPYTCVPLRLDRFSPYFDDPEGYGIENVRPLPSYRYVYPGLPEELVQHMVSYFEFDYKDGRQVPTYVAELRKAVDDWRNAAGSELFSTKVGGNLVIFDLRPAAVQNMHVLNGVLASLYQYCDSIRSRDSVLRYLAEQGHQISTAELAEWIAPLLQSLLMVGEGNNLLTLAIPLAKFSPGLAGAKRFLAFLDEQRSGSGFTSDSDAVASVPVPSEIQY